MDACKNKNMEIWNQVKTTKEQFAKQTRVDGRSVTSINHLGMVEKATELWGPIGINWGYEIVEERDDQGRPIVVDGQVQGHEITHTLRLKLWYEHDGKRGEIENYGHTPRIYYSQKGGYWVEDKEAAKKSLTDAFKKCLSFLGFSADIYSGEWDDPEYRNERQLASRIEKAENKEREQDIQRQELKDYVQKHLETLKAAKHANEVKGIYRTAFRHVERQKAMPHLADIAIKGAAALTREFEKKCKELEEQQ